MPAGLIQETFDGGVVTKRNPTMLRPGEIQEASDCVYRKFDPTIHGVAGRTEFNSSAISGTPAIKGLTHLSFDEGDDLLVAYAGTNLYGASFTSLSGSFTQIQGVGTLENDGSETLEVVHFSNAYYLLPSRNRPRRVSYINAPRTTNTSSTMAGDGVTLTTTTANGFANVIVGQSVTGTGIIAGAKVQVKNSTTSVTLTPGGSTPGAIADIVFTEALITEARIAGLDPVSKFILTQIVVNTGTGSWNSQLGNGFYWFLLTEMYIPGKIDDINTGFVESGFTGEIQRAQITDYTNQSISITYGTATFPFVNSLANDRLPATHWQVYMSEKQVDGTAKPSLATFKRIGAPIPVATTTATLRDDVSNDGPKNPTAHADLSGAGRSTFDNPLLGYKPHDSGDFFGGMSSTAADAIILLRAFGFVGTGAVTGVTVRVYGRADPSGSATTRAHGYAYFRRQDQTKRSLAHHFEFTPDWTTVTFGGQFDTWGASWTDGDFADGAFELVIEKGASAAIQRLVVDGVDVTIHFTGTSVNLNGLPFRVITFRSQVGITVSDSANLPNPEATTGDTFNGSIVTNWRGHPNALRYSLPGLPESWPLSYVMYLQSRKKDEVTFVRTLSQVLIVGLSSSIKRVNYLPTENDTDFTSGLAHEDLAIDHGIAGPHAATLFDMGGGGVLLAYVSYKGIHVTDGITTRFLNIDLDWENTVDVNNLDTCILRNYTKENWLVLFYAPAGTSHGKNTRAIIFSYSPEKIKDGGMLPAIGPMKVSARSAVEVTLNGVPYYLTGHQATGKVYVEDQGLTLPASYTVANSAGSEAAISLTPRIITRRFYPAGVGRQTREERTYLHCNAAGASITAASNTTIDSTAVTSSALFGNVTVGMLVTGTEILPGTIVTAKTDSNNITISQAAIATGTGITLTFTNGTVSITVRGQNIGEVITQLNTGYISTQIGGLVRLHLDNLRQALELQFDKVLLPSGAQQSLSTGMQLNYFAYLATDMGQETDSA